MDLSTVNDHLDAWFDRTVTDIGDSAVMALKDRSAAELVKDQLSVQEAASPVLKNKVLNSTRHYFTDIEGGETFDYYYKDTTLTGEARYAASNNLWNDLTDESTFGKPFILGYCNGASGYLPNYDAYVYNQGSDRWAMGAYEAHKTKLEQGSCETMVRTYDTMLDDLLSGSGGTTWTSGVLGYSIGVYCSGQSAQWADVAALAEATAVYGYHAKQYFG